MNDKYTSMATKASKAPSYLGLTNH